MTPLILTMLLHCHFSPEPIENTDNLAIKEGIKLLLEWKMIVHIQGDSYQTTGRGDAHIKHLLAVPFPVNQWVLPS